MKFQIMLGHAIPYKFKFDLKMKLTVYLFLISLFQIHANSYSQNAKISLELKNVSIENVLQTIESKSEFKFLYNDNQVDYKKLVSIKFKKTKISKILNTLFSDTNINFEVLNKQIILVLEPRKPNNKNLQQLQKTYKGTVVDASGIGVPGANILIKGSTKGAVTDFDGNFTIQANSGDVLEITFLGYVTKLVTLGSQTSINVALEEDASKLDEVVVIGYGTAKKSDLTGSVSLISSKDLLKAPITKIGSGLQGKVSGVNIQQTSGAPGQSMKIRIRGGSSINYSNNPLYVIDGFIGADISTVNPNDIATINFLKDASATAIYGSRGANGVVLITTVAPKEGKLKVSIDTNIGFSNPINSYDILSAAEQAELMNLQNISKGNSAFFTDSQIETFRLTGGTNWQDLVTRSGLRQNYSINVTGGSENLKYFFSANHLDEEGIIKNSFYKRTSLRSNISGKIGNKINFKFNTYGTHTDSQANGRGTGGLNNIMGAAVTFPQQWASRDENGDFLHPDTYDGYNGAFLIGRYANPEQKVLQNQENVRDRISSNIDLDVKLTDNLTLAATASGSFNFGYNGQRTLLEPTANGNRTELVAGQDYSRNNNWLANSRLTYENDFGDHNLKVSGVYEFSKGINRNLSADVNNLSTLANEWYLLSNGQPTITSSAYNIGKIRSYMGRLNYGYKGKYLLTASMRADGSSRFSKDTRWGYFPSAAIAWKASEESFIQDIDWIDNLKIRAGYGEVGNQAVGAYAIIPAFDTTNDGAQYRWYALDNNNPVEGIVPGAIVDPNLKWETTTSYNAGIDFGILGNKLTGSIDVYSKQATDVIIAKSIARYTGQSSTTSNYAAIDNNGVEIGLNWKIKSTNDFNWTAYGNFTKNKNKVKDLDGADEIFIANEEALGIWSLVGGNSKFIVRKGESMGSFFGLKAMGLWQEDEATEAATYGAFPGEVKYEDIDESGDITAADRQIVGNAQADFTYGLGTSITYKDFDISIQCIGSVGNDIYNWTDNKLDNNILSTGYKNRWSPTNTSSTQQIMPIQTDYSNTYLVGQYIEDGTFFKISNITVGYNLPQNVTDALKISNFRLYASIDNVLTITNYSGLDPEGSSTPINSDSQAGVDAFSYPLVRTISAGLKVSF